MRNIDEQSRDGDQPTKQAKIVAGIRVDGQIGVAKISNHETPCLNMYAKFQLDWMTGRGLKSTCEISPERLRYGTRVAELAKSAPVRSVCAEQQSSRSRGQERVAGEGSSGCNCSGGRAIMGLQVAHTTSSSGHSFSHSSSQPSILLLLCEPKRAKRGEHGATPEFKGAAREKGAPRENPPTGGIVRRYSHLRKSGSNSASGIEPSSPSARGEQSNRSDIAGPHDGNTPLLARRSDEALGVRVSVARIAPSLLDLGCAGPRLPCAFSEFGPENRVCDKGDPATHIKFAIAAMRKGLNWHEAFSSLYRLCSDLPEDFRRCITSGDFFLPSSLKTNYTQRHETPFTCHQIVDRSERATNFRRRKLPLRVFNSRELKPASFARAETAVLRGCQGIMGNLSPRGSRHLRPGTEAMALEGALRVPLGKASVRSNLCHGCTFLKAGVHESLIKMAEVDARTYPSSVVFSFQWTDDKRHRPQPTLPYIGCAVSVYWPVEWVSVVSWINK
ncbi:hypothetical protein PR048_007575 [Dryococelus australis]|uniref:Uncharacterized protein n=1 Tax=Dryococelus australis TaxID=614101 RepID=A0ABQ9HUL5_9NEOP|nr:hypothetical protein PR048_007575 [Dryococelus australis]